MAAYLYQLTSRFFVLIYLCDYALTLCLSEAIVKEIDVFVIHLLEIIIGLKKVP